jgi:hypothetical protein
MTPPAEYTITRNREGLYCIAVDGVWAVPEFRVAIDWIPEVDCVGADGAPLTTDQRGEPRPVAILGAEPKCDVGAFEVQP